jgi:predicted  nucleic acid-binding Zn-ribbon protein
LYSGQVHSSKELSDRQADVEQHRRQCAQAEEELLAALIAVEAAQAAAAQAQATLDQMTAEREQITARLLREQARLKQALPALQARQSAARRAAPAELLPLYDSLRARRGGRAVAELDGDTCSVCKVAASPSKVEAARYGDEPVHCENCGRLLWGE